LITSFLQCISGGEKHVAAVNTARSFLFIAVFWQWGKKIKDAIEKNGRLKPLEEIITLDAIFRLRNHKSKNLTMKTSSIPWLPFHFEEKSKYFEIDFPPGPYPGIKS